MNKYSYDYTTRHRAHLSTKLQQIPNKTVLKLFARCQYQRIENVR